MTLIGRSGPRSHCPYELTSLDRQRNVSRSLPYSVRRNTAHALVNSVAARTELESAAVAGICSEPINQVRESHRGVQFMLWSSRSWLMSLLTRHQTGIVGRMPRARRRRGQKAGASRPAANCDCLVETLEGRLLLSATASTTFTLLSRGSHGTKPSATAGVAPIDPAQMQAAYGVNQIAFGGTAGTG